MSATFHGSSFNERDSGDLPAAEPPKFREVKFEYTPAFPQILEHLGASLLISTYQAGKLIVLGTEHGKLTISVRNFDRPMGIAVGPHSIAIGTRRQIHFLSPADELAPRIQPAGSFDRCWVPRSTFYTGNIHGHELAWGDAGLWVVNTLFSSLCTLHEGFNFVPRWRPRFISQLIDQDRCHLNGLALQNGQPKYVTLMAESDAPAGWRPSKATSGCVVDVPSGETVARGFSMPHSPRLFRERLWVLDSGKGQLNTIEPSSGKVQTIVEVPGYTRGLALAGQFAFVGMSRIRETSVFSGLPIADRRTELRCGVAIVDLISGQAVAKFEFQNGVEEVFAVEVLHETRNPALYGPSPEDDQQQEIWIVPPPGCIPARDDGPAIFARGAKPPLISPTPMAAPIPTPNPQTAVAGIGTSVGLTSKFPSQIGTAQAFLEKGNLLHRQGRLSEATAYFRLAADQADDPAPALTDLGNVYQELGDQDQALECYREAVRSTPSCVPAHQNLGYLLFNQGDPQLALNHYEQALRYAPSPINRLLAASVLPVVYESLADVQHWRQRLESQLASLTAAEVKIDATRQMVPTGFFLAYQGLNDRTLMTHLGQIFQGENSCRGRSADVPGPTTHATKQIKRLRVGFLSAYFRDHTIGRLNLGRIQHLSRQHLEISVIYAARQIDSISEKFRSAADHYVQLARDVSEARRQIAELNLDVLIFADVGMDALTSTLAFSRMAPIQCATWGHPDTTGSPFMDYFLSSDLLELPEADEHYSEKLVRLPNLATYYERPRRSGPPRTRETFGLDPKRHIYLCPQTLFKFHPEFDSILAAILTEDPLGDLVLLEGRVPNWTRRLQARFEQTLGPAARRVHFLPAQPRDDFLALLETADVILDPIHFGGGHTSYEALAVGVPIVTLPGQFLRSRITQALYRHMNVTSPIVHTPEEYIQLALDLGTNPAIRTQLSQQILNANGILFENQDEVTALETWLLNLSESNLKQ